MRFLLGAAEAGFFPGVDPLPDLLAAQRYRPRIVAHLHGRDPAGDGLIGSPISGALLYMDGVLGPERLAVDLRARGAPAMLLGICRLIVADRQAP